ncbi:nucleotide-binding universal stress UspA family protein [Lewinella aquimaris]|uniref:Nucleotide-binding universal stress UspA family protein n=1 Tax=Neolewinella aquimaris TaxID=1835722 RepID=A0A840E5U9_9BACT|nr:universal stress protein [Neolewinella aquimaris]MBB4079092.1 nucleotide-binding universal stress UspA family protein [Neolewinella aquimaris]
MRHILVPTDFSKAADNATAYAAILATEFGARITLAYIHSMPMDPMRIGEVSAELYRDGEAHMNALAERLRQQGLAVEVRMELGTPAARLKSIIQHSDTDLVVMGCQGEHYIPAKFFGSTTTELMDEVAVPILAVPGDFAPAFPQKMVWTTDEISVRRAETLYPLFDLVDRAGTELKVFHYRGSKPKAFPEDRVKELLSDVRYDLFTQSNDGASVDQAIRGFVRTVAADLLAIVHRDSHWLSRVLMSSNTRRAVWTSAVPILVLQEQLSFAH